MIFYVIVNGFDLHYQLPTGYNHFKNYLINKGHRELVRKIDRLFWERGGYSPDEIKKWSTFEDMLQVFNNLFADELYEEAFDNAETDDDRAGFWDSPAWNVNYYNEYIEVLKQEFDNWINEMDTQIVPDNYFCPLCGDAILTFNYTTTVEDNFIVDGISITHIHGTKNQSLILGHNEPPNPDLFSIVEDEESDYRDITTKKAINGVLRQASENYYKNSEQILNGYRYLFRQIPHYDKVVIMGLSCGEQDRMYVKEIINHASIIDFYYYDETAKSNFEDIIDRNNLTVNYYKW